MILVATTLVIIPDLILGKYEIPAPKAKVNFQAVCDFHNMEIDKLEQNVKKLVKDVDLKSELYGKLNELKYVCGDLAYRVLPHCATKEGMNVFDKLDDECAEKRTNFMKNTFQKIMKLAKPPTGEEIFRSCKDIATKDLLEQFKKMQGLVSSLCDDKSQSGSSRRKRSYDDGYYPEYHDSSAVWYQYQLCQEQKMLDPEYSCYFFTQGWNQVDYGQYYLYQNTLESDVTIPDISIPDINLPDDDLLAVALLSDSGTQEYHPDEGYPAYYPDEGYPAYPDEGYPAYYPDEGYPAYYPDQGYPAYYPDQGYPAQAYYPAYPSYRKSTGVVESVTEIETVDETLEDIPLVETLPVSAPAEDKVEEAEEERTITIIIKG